LVTVSEPIERLAAALPDRYQLERKLGSGGMATVYLATIIQIASHTKPVTATAVAMLVDEGRLSWDDPVRMHSPSSNCRTRTLLNMLPSETY